MESKFWEDVEAGETLPVLEFPITVKTLILAVCGTRDLMPYHHDPEYSKSVGNRDMFVNTMFEQALFGRYATDFAGPESDFRETGLQMLNQLCPGDVARIEGTVTEKLADFCDESYWDCGDGDGDARNAVPRGWAREVDRGDGAAGDGRASEDSGFRERMARQRVLEVPGRLSRERSAGHVLVRHGRGQ
ncbi:MAG: hypothetical protein ACKVIW_01305 [bacterium]